jgi:hypothetical protein
MRTLPILAAALCGCALAAGADDPWPFAFVYDAQAKLGPCPISELDYRRLQSPTPPPQGVIDAVFAKRMCTARPFQFKDSSGLNALNVLILRPRFRADYSATVTFQNQKPDGVIPIRGLTDVSPANIISPGTPALQGTPAPVAHGGREPSTVTVAPITPAQVIAQLVDEPQSGQILLTLNAQARDLADAEFTLRQDSEEYHKAVKRVRGAPGEAQCAGLSGAPTVEGLATCAGMIVTQISNNNNTAFRPGLTYPGCNRTLPDAGTPWVRDEFDCIVKLIDMRVADLALLGGRLAEYGFRGVSDRIETESEALVARTEAFLGNLDIVNQAVTDFETVRTAAVQAMPLLRQAEIKRQLKDKYGAVLDETQLNQLAGFQEKAVTQKFDPSFQRNVQELRNHIAQWRQQATRNTEDCAACIPAPSQIRDRENQARTAAFELAGQVDSMNSDFALLFNAINDVYLKTPDPRALVTPIDLSTGSGGNRDVYCVLKSDEQFKPYQFAATIQAAAAQQGGPVVSATPNPQLTATPANLPVNIKEIFDFEVHKFWHANVVAGFVFSSLASRQYAVQTVNVIQNGVSTPQNIPVLANSQVPTAHYLLGICYYLWPRDTYLRTNTKGPAAGNWIPGILGGVGLESSKNFFVGPNFEPVMGIDLSIGFHYGEQTALQPQYSLGTPLPAGAVDVPTRTVMAKGFYGMIGFDLNIFRRIFGVGTGTLK